MDLIFLLEAKIDWPITRPDPNNSWLDLLKKKFVKILFLITSWYYVHKVQNTKTRNNIQCLSQPSILLCLTLDSRQDKSLHKWQGSRANRPRLPQPFKKKKKKKLIQCLLVASCSPSLGQSTKCTNTIQLYNKQTWKVKVPHFLYFSKLSSLAPPDSKVRPLPFFSLHNSHIRHFTLF